MPPSPATEPPAPLGGFFGLEPSDAASAGLAAHWGDAGLNWVNATSALAALVRHLRPGAVWLPGYVCDTLSEAVPPALRRFYPLDRDLGPDIAALGPVRPGDVVLAVDLFGRAPGRAWGDFVAAHPAAIFVEDCAQALDTGAAPWGDFRLYSARKLVGVPEGGLLVPVTGKARARAVPGPARPSDPAAAAIRAAPILARAEAPGDNARWHPLHQAAERAQTVTDDAMSDAAHALLATLDPVPRIAARKRNFRRLAARLADVALLPETDPGFAPFGFPVRLPEEHRDAVLNRLYSARIFPAVHWRAIAAPPGFAADHARARQLATLPCDHRYGPADMDRLADALLEACP